MRIVDSILMELDQEAQTTKRVLDRFGRQTRLETHAKSFSLGQLALHIASVPAASQRQQCRTVWKPQTFTAGAKSRRKFWTLSPKPRECKGHLRKWMMLDSCHVELDEKRKGPDVGPAIASFARSSESQLSPSRHSRYICGC